MPPVEARSSRTEQLPTAKRHAARSREAILEAATDVFAEQGYASATMQTVGLRAGLSRGTPGYFFGSKEKLYQAVLARAFEQARGSLRAAQEEAEKLNLDGPAVFRHAVSAYLDFLAANPRFVRLVEWEALSSSGHLGLAETHTQLVMAALEGMGEALRAHLPPGYDLAQLMLSIAGMCWFPVAHRDTLARVLQVDPLAADFIKERKEHVGDLVLKGMCGPGRREEE